MKKTLIIIASALLLTACGNGGGDEQVKEGKKAQINNEIVIESPRIGDLVTSPLVVKGEARGTWFFEGVFPVELLGKAGQSIKIVPATSSEPWMTEDFIPFEATIEFDSTGQESGTLRLRKDNPSGLPENDMAIGFPVNF